jgi:hypothetical protein
MIKQTVENLSRAAWLGILTGSLLLLAVPLLPRAFGQPRPNADNRSLPHDATKASQSQLLPYDIRPNPPASPRPRGFHNVNGVLPQAERTEASKIPLVRPLEPSGTCPSTITQSTSQAVAAGNSAACSDPGIGTLESHYWRAFDMNTFTDGQAYNITSVEFGIEQALSLFGTDQPLTVNLYTNHGAPFPGGDWQSNLLATSGSINVANQKGTIFNVPITATVPAGTLELVMEVMSPDQTAAHNFFIIGSNPDPETGTSYISAPDCGNSDPLGVACVGLYTMHYVFNVNGSCAGGATPTPTPAPSATPSPTPIEITGSIDNSDPTQVDRLNRSGISGCCGAVFTSCQIFGDAQLRHYDAYTFTNTTGSTQCVDVNVNTACSGNNFIFTAAYLGTFDPNNICNNWIADEGSSPGPTAPFSFIIDNGQTVVLVVSEVNAGAGCPSYTMTVSGLGAGGTPTPTPTATATPTPTPTATATPTSTPRPSPTPRGTPIPRERPTPHPRP